MPAGTINAYQSKKGWKEFQHIEEIGGGTTIAINVTNEEGEGLPNQVNILWYDANGKEIGRGEKLSGIADSTEVYYSVLLDETLGRVYREVQMQKVVVGNENETITCKLQRIEVFTLHGIVMSGGTPVIGAELQLVQWLNGKYEYTASTQTDDKGEFELKAYNDTTQLTVSAQGYIDKAITRSRLYGTSLGSIELEPVKGMQVVLALSYQEATKEGEEPILQNWYSDLRNITYTVRNVTKGTDITDFDMQQGTIVLPFGSEPGDSISVVLHSLNGKFASVRGGGTIGEDGIATISILLLAPGGIEVNYGQKADDELLTMLYNEDGKLVSSNVTSASRTVFTGLEAGSYTVISMGYNGTFGTFSERTDLAAFGLVSGSDYATATITIQDGIIGTATIAEVPELDASKFDYTSLNTSYLPNKSEMTVNGSYVTLTARVDFKAQYANEVSGVKLLVDIPEGCEFIPNSVVTGTKALVHSLNGKQLAITLGQEDIDSRIRFCMTPKQPGTFTSTAYAEFDCRGEKRQSIGTAVFEATAGSIAVPKLTASKTIAVSGIAAPHATVSVFDNDQQIGTTTALGDGKWRTDVELYQPYNLSTHEIHAIYQTDDGIHAATASQSCFYDMNQVKAKSATMSFYNGWMRKNIDVVFDFETGKTSSNNYSFYTATDFTFVADLTDNDTTRVQGVTFYVHTSTKEVRKLNSFFDEKLGRWVAVSKFDSYNLPVNLSVEVVSTSDPLVDRQFIDDGMEVAVEVFEQRKTEIADIDSLLSNNESSLDNQEIYDELESILSLPEYDEEKVQELLKILLENIPQGSEDEISDEEIELLDKEFDRHQKQIEQALLYEQTIGKDSLLVGWMINPDFVDAGIPEGTFSCDKEGNGLSYHYEVIFMSSIDEQKLQDEGYVAITVTDGTKLYALMTEDVVSFVDSRKGLKYVFSNDYFSHSKKNAPTANSILNTDCLEAARNIISLIQDKESNVASWKRNAETYQSAMESLSCFYSAALAAIDNRIHDALVSRLSALEPLIEAERERLAAYRNWLSKQKVFPANRLLFMEKIEMNIQRLCQQRDNLTQSFERFFRPLNSLPRNLNATTQLGQAVKAFGRIAGGLGVLIDIYECYVDCRDAVEDIDSWIGLYNEVERYYPCKKEPDKLDAIRNNVITDAQDLMQTYTRIISNRMKKTVVDAASLVSWEVPHAEAALYIASVWGGTFIDCYKIARIENGEFILKNASHRKDLKDLTCNDNEDEEEQDDDDGDFSEGTPTGGAAPITTPTTSTPPITPIHDPSGFVYEAVPTNRVEGVKATIYYDQEKPTQWDAADFSQVNPIVTDETGVYAWDVPQGMWQVRFEKSGYETAQTEWLPVPPPQMEINIPMQEAVAPTVVKVRGMESGITLDFSKYMKPSTLDKSGRVSTTVNGKKASGDVEMMNLEEDPYNQKTYASKVRFVPDVAFKTTDEVVITVKKEVESYADKQMDTDFVQLVKIEPEIKGFECDSLIAIDYQGEGVLEIAVLPGTAAKGRVVAIESTSSMIATADGQVTLDENGKACIAVKGELPGSCSLHLVLAGTDIDKYVEVIVVIQEKVVKKPKASKRDGSTLEAGELVGLTSNTKGATIYYTLDGSCPCDEATRRKYTEPLLLPAGKVTLKAMAVRQGMEDSDVATFVYTVEGEDAIRDGQWAANVQIRYEEGSLVVEGATGAMCRVYDLQGHLLAQKASLRNHTSISVPSSLTTYIVSVQLGNETIARKVRGY